MIIVAAIACLAAYLAVSGPAALAFGVISQAIFIVPGILILRAIAPREGWLPAAAFGPLVGQALGCFVMTLLWVAGGRGAWLLIAAPLIVSVLAWPARRLKGRWRFPVTQPHDALAVGLLLILVAVIVGLPFAHVGDITPAGQAYRAYFTADYVWRRAVVIELAKGAAIPVNPYFSGDVLHYYWMPHILTGAQYRFAGAWASLDELLLIRSISIDLFFITFLYGMVRLFALKPWAAAAGVAFVVVSTSFEGLYVLFDFSTKNVPISAVKNLNIDAISRWYFQGIPIDGLQRLLLYQPHHIVGYCIGLIGLLALSARTRIVDPAAFAVSGVCLGLSIAISSFAGVMVTSAAMLYEFIGVVRTMDWLRGIKHAVAAAIPLLVSVGVVFWLGYVDRSGSVVEFVVNPVAVHRFWWVTLLSFGPILIVTALAIPALLYGRQNLSMLGALAVTSIAFYFFINVRDHQDVYVGWRVGHFLFMSAAVVIGVLLEWVYQRPSAWQPLQWAVIVIALLSGLPTTIIDIYNTQDISEHGEAPYFTMMMRPDELQAFDWIQKNTRPDSLFQVDPIVRAV
ncbi:MAG TPA: hypothetical protein VM096_02350, partial [Vicinamibacterales bacterium]|nr:hypothetical protein [Vicinamibacterales bacterium]